MQTFGEIVKQVLDKKGLTQSDLAKSMGVSRQNIGLLLKTLKPRIDTVERVAVALGVNLIDLLPHQTQTQQQALPVTFESAFPYRREAKKFQKLGDIEYILLPFVSLPARASFAEIGDGISVDMHETVPVIKIA